MADTRSLDEAKMILVGEGEVGKTSIVKKLLDEPFDPKEGKTHGIDRRVLQVPLNGRSVHLNVWDFGGQEIMHATHQFFLTARSLYLVVLDSRHNQQQSRVEYWLKLIQTFGGNSPIIMVCNKCDQQYMDLDWSGLMAKYPNICACARTVSCETGEGIDELRDEISRRVTLIPHVGDLFPASWFAIKKNLEGMEEDYIEYDAYQVMCRENGIVRSTEQQWLVGFLHDLGTVLHFHDHPILRATNILNPRWVTTAVYRILNSNRLFVSGGVLRIEDLEVLLHDLSDHYPKEKAAFIIEIMKRFELCFEFDDNEQREFLIPDLLPLESPDTGDWDDSIGFQIRYDVLPSSIMSRLIVRLHASISRRTYWRTGVVLKSEGKQVLKDGEPVVRADGTIQRTEGNRALVKADLEDHVISISVSGNHKSRGQLLQTIRDELEHIHRTMPGIRAVEYAAIPNHPTKFVEYDYLFDLEAAGQRDYLIPGVRRRVAVADLLADIGTDDVFVSYSHDDAEWLNRLQTVLSPALSNGRVSVWSDSSIHAGMNWRQEISRKLETSRVAVLLVSPNFLSSKFITEVELPYLIRASKERGVTILWILLSACLYRETCLPDLQAAHDIARPLDTFRTPKLNQVLTEIAQKIIAAVAK